MTGLMTIIGAAFVYALSKITDGFLFVSGGILAAFVMKEVLHMGFC